MAEVEAELEEDGVVFSFGGVVVGVLEAEVGVGFFVLEFAGEGDGEAVAGGGVEGVFDFAHVEFGAGGAALEVLVAEVGDPLFSEAIAGEGHVAVLGG